MSETNKGGSSRSWLWWFMPLLLFGFLAFIAFLISDKNVAIFNPKGLIAYEQFRLLVFVLILLLAAALPVMFLLYFTAWKYRESNTKAVRDPYPFQSKFLAWVIWLVPIAFLLILTPIMWSTTHKFEPKKTLVADAKPLTVQVIAMRWKWVFLYPEQKIATVNFVQIPKDTPVTFELTADEAPMSSFWIPNLGGQLYSMTSHVNRLNLMGETVGDYRGSSAEINGAGFSGMKFIARVSTAEDFENWVQEVKQSQQSLDKGGYRALLKPSENNPVALYANYNDSIFDSIVKKYSGSHDSHTSPGDHTSHGDHE
jgi:cytochrome o ubiquinol oxidase subunit II